MGGLAVMCVVLGMSGVHQLITVGAVVMMLAPLGALSSVAVAAIRARDRLAAYAVGAIVVTGAGMLLAW